jgi:glycosyltransferase involved in cell wall biosynthesis
MHGEAIKLLKILRVTNDLYPDVVGGIALHTHHLCRDLSRMGYYTTVLTCAKGNHRYEKKEEGYDVIHHKIFFSPLGNSFSPSIFRTLLKIKDDYDLIHAHCHLFLSTIMASLVRRIGSPPLIITTHGIMSASAPDWFNILYMKTIGKWTLKSADRVICYTEMEKDTLANMLKIDSEKISVIPNGVDTDLFRPDSNNNNRSNQSNAITILWAGRFVRGKGVEFIIHATKILVKEVPDLKILLVGDGPSKGKIKSLIEKFNLKKNVIIKENISNENMPEVYQKSDIFVLPSLNEGVPRTLLEAMACGKPVVISEFPHLADMIKNAGLTFPKGDVHSLAANIKKLIENKELAQKLGNNGKNKILKYHSWENTVLKTIELYEEVAGHKGRGD